MSDETLRVGRIGKCRTFEAIGAGGMATVYLGHHDDLDIRVAVKILSPQILAAHAGMAERFVREARIAARIDHPNLVRVFDCGEADGRHYLVMEHVPGGSLKGRLDAHGPLGWREALDCGIQVARALEAVWAERVIHRDIKPANLLLDGKGTVKLADLGLAKCLADSDADALQTGFMGTPRYVSPEQSWGGVDIRTDIYALGVTLYELIVGDPPFEADSALDLMALHRDAPRPKLPEDLAPPALAQLVCEMMARDPAERPPDPTILLRRLSAVAQPPVAPRRRWVWVAGMLVAVAVGAVGWWLSGLGGAPPITPRFGDIQGEVEQLADDRIRLRYDFSDADQLEDWRPANAGSRAHIEDGWLVIQRDPEVSGSLAVMLHRLPMRVERISFDAELIEGDHLNFYVNTIWNDQWHPEYGYAGIYRDSERLLILEGKAEDVAPFPWIQPGKRYSYRVEVGAAELRWYIDDEPFPRQGGRQHQGTDRHLGLGAWESRVRFTNVVIEGRVKSR